MEKNNVKKKRGSVVWALGLSWLSTLLLAILAIFLMLLTTICSEGFMRKQVTRSSFADYAYSYLYDNYVSYGASTGFDADVMTSTLSRDQINTDMEQAVTDLYAGNTAVNARENIKTDLNAVLVADLNSRGKDVTEDVASAVEIVADACRLDYANYVAIPLASQLYTVITKVDRLALPGVIVTALLCAVSLVLMLRLAGSSRLDLHLYGRCNFVRTGCHRSVSPAGTGQFFAGARLYPGTGSYLSSQYAWQPGHLCGCICPRGRYSAGLYVRGASSAEAPIPK